MTGSPRSAWNLADPVAYPNPIPLSGRLGYTSKDKRWPTILEGSMYHIGTTQKVVWLVQADTGLYGAGSIPFTRCHWGMYQVYGEALAALNHPQSSRYVLECLWTTLNCLTLDTGGYTAIKPLRVRLFKALACLWKPQ